MIIIVLLLIITMMPAMVTISDARYRYVPTYKIHRYTSLISLSGGRGWHFILSSVSYTGPITPPSPSKVPTSSAHPFHPSRSSRDAFQKPLHSPSRTPPRAPPGEDRANMSSPAPAAWRSFAAAPQAHGRQQDHGIRRVLELAPLARLGAPPWLGDVTVPARDLWSGGRPHNNDSSQSGTSPAPPAKILATKALRGSLSPPSQIQDACCHSL